MLFFSLYLVMIACAAGLGGLWYLIGSPSMTSGGADPQGHAIKPWASINEIMGHDVPERDDEEWMEAA